MVATSGDLTKFDSLVSDKIEVLAKMPQKQHNDKFFLKKLTLFQTKYNNNNNKFY